MDTPLIDSRDAGLAGREVSLSVVVPCYNEQDCLEELVGRLDRVCRSSVGERFEIILVNDGSRDRTWAEILRLSVDVPQIVGVNLSRNHGHQLALSAGLSVATGGRILIIDADLQDPPELLPELMRALDEGHDVAFGQRTERDGETWFKRTTAALFYRLIRRATDVAIPVDAGDFRLITRRTAQLLLAMPEHHRFTRGLVAWIGLPQKAVPYRREARFAGETKYTLGKMVRLAIDAIMGFSVAPLRLSLYLGLISTALAAVLGVYVLWSWLARSTEPGWTSIAVMVLTFGALQMFCIGIIGEYVGQMYTQSKQRPLFVIDLIHRGGTPSEAQKRDERLCASG